MGDMVKEYSLKFKNIVIPLWLSVIISVLILTLILWLSLNLHFFMTLSVLLFLSGLALYLRLYLSHKDHYYHTKILKRRSNQLLEYLTSFSRKISTLEKEYTYAMQTLSQLSEQVTQAQQIAAQREQDLAQLEVQKPQESTSFMKSMKARIPTNKITVAKQFTTSHLQQDLLHAYPSFPQKNRKQRIALQRYTARLLQDKDNHFTISQVLTTLIQTYPVADNIRDTLSLEIKRWIESDPYVIKHTKGTVTKYQLT